MIAISSNQPSTSPNKQAIEPNAMATTTGTAGAFFDNLDQDIDQHRGGFSSQESSILNKMMIHSNAKSATARGRASSKQKQAPMPRSDSTDSSAMHDSVGTTATMTEDYSNATGATSISVMSLTGSVVPIKRHLSQHEEQQSYFNSGPWDDNESFGSVEEEQFPSWSRPSGANSRMAKSRGSSVRTNSRRSLDSVDEDEELPSSPVVSREQTAIRIIAQQPQVQDDEEISLDPLTLEEYSSAGSKKLSPVHEQGQPMIKEEKSFGKSKKKKKKNGKKKKNKNASKNKSKEFASASADSADDILARWNAKIVDLERSVSELESGGNHESGGDLGLSSNKSLFESTPESAALSPSSSISPTSSPTTTATTTSTRSKDKLGHRNRPSLHTVFEWNSNPSPSVSPLDPAAGINNKRIVNSSTIRDRRRKLRKSYSTTDVNQYNNTPMWPPTKRHATRGLHSQFFRRDTNLPTPPGSGLRVPTPSSPVVSSKQMLDIMEPVTMREVLEFKGFADQESKNRNGRNSLNYGAVLDHGSESSIQSSQASSTIPKILRAHKLN